MLRWLLLIHLVHEVLLQVHHSLVKVRLLHLLWECIVDICVLLCRVSSLFNDQLVSIIFLFLFLLLFRSLWLGILSCLFCLLLQFLELFLHLEDLTLHFAVLGILVWVVVLLTLLFHILYLLLCFLILLLLLCLWSCSTEWGHTRHLHSRHLHTGHLHTWHLHSWHRSSRHATRSSVSASRHLLYLSEQWSQG